MSASGLSFSPAGKAFNELAYFGLERRTFGTHFER